MTGRQIGRNEKRLLQSTKKKAAIDIERQQDWRKNFGKYNATIFKQSLTQCFTQYLSNWTIQIGLLALKPYQTGLPYALSKSASWYIDELTRLTNNIAKHT